MYQADALSHDAANCLAELVPIRNIPAHPILASGWPVSGRTRRPSHRHHSQQNPLPLSAPIPPQVRLITDREPWLQFQFRMDAPACLLLPLPASLHLARSQQVAKRQGSSALGSTKQGACAPTKRPELRSAQPVADRPRFGPRLDGGVPKDDDIEDLRQLHLRRRNDVTENYSMKPSRDLRAAFERLVWPKGGGNQQA